MATPSPSSRPAWQSNPVFRFFASLKLAVVLLAVLIIGSVAGTLYESSFDAKVARAYVYGAPWFNLWLLLLAANLAGAAFSRWPWKKHHVGFLITHLGIITLLAGSLIGRIWGIEGTITLFKGEPPTNRLLVDEHQLRVRDTDGIVKGYAAEFINRPPTPQKPWDLGLLAGGGRLSIVDYAPAIEGKPNPKPLKEGGAPARPFHGRDRDDGPAARELAFGGRSPAQLQHGSRHDRREARRRARHQSRFCQCCPLAAAGEVEIEETIFAFAKAPEEQIAKVIKGGNSGAKVQLTEPKEGNKGSVVVNLNGKTWTFDVAQTLGKDAAMEGSAFTLRIDNYWPDFRIENGKPTSVSDQPNNAAVVVTLRGKGVPVSSTPGHSHGADTPGVAPEMPAAGANTGNHMTLFIAPDGSVTYDLTSRKLGRSTGKLELNKPLTTGWADWELTLDRFLPHAEEWMDFVPTQRAGHRSRFAGWRPRPHSTRRANFRAMGSRRLADQRPGARWRCAGGLRLEADSVADRAGASRFRSPAQRRQRQPRGIQKHGAGDYPGRPDRYRPMLDEQPVQLSRRMAEHLDRPHLQNVAGFLEPGQPRPKHHPDFARPGLAPEMGRLASPRLRHLPALLCEEFPASVPLGCAAAIIEACA